jgi:hypothetical protein
VIDEKKIDTEEAVKTTLNWIDNKDVLKKQLIQSLDIAKRDNTKFINDVKNLIVNS